MPKELRKMLMKVIENPDMATDIGNNGCKSIMKFEHFNGYVDKTINIYNSILNK